MIIGGKAAASEGGDTLFSDAGPQDRVVTLHKYHISTLLTQ
jgi:hypothetical protein